MIPLLSLAATIAPWLARHVFGGDAGPVAERVAAAAEVALGTRDPEQAAAIIAGDPAKADAFRTRLAELEADLERERIAAALEAARIGAADTSDARAMGRDLAVRGHALAWMPAAVTGFLAVMFGAAGWALLSAPQDFPAGVREAALLLLGVLAGEFRGACGYWLGSSAGSRANQEAVRNALSAPLDRSR